MFVRAFTLSLALALGTAVIAPPSAVAQGVQQDLADARSTLNQAISTVYAVRSDSNFQENFERYLHRAKGVLIVPSFLKGGFIIGGSYGNGLLMTRDRSGAFSAPAFYTMGGGSLGLQIGGQSAQMVFLIMTDRGLTSLMNDEFKVGAGVGVTFVTEGANLEAATTSNLSNDILAFARAKGAYGGATIDGAVIKPRHDWNQAFYGRGATPKAIVLDRRFPNPEAEPLWEALTIRQLQGGAPYAGQAQPQGQQPQQQYGQPQPLTPQQQPMAGGGDPQSGIIGARPVQPGDTAPVEGMAPEPMDAPGGYATTPAPAATGAPTRLTPGGVQSESLAPPPVQ